MIYKVSNKRFCPGGWQDARSEIYSLEVRADHEEDRFIVYGEIEVWVKLPRPIS